MSGPAVDSDAWIKQSNKRCFTGGMKAVAPLGVLRDSDGKPIARSGEGWVEGTGEPPMRLEDIVTKAKAEAREAQWPVQCALFELAASASYAARSNWSRPSK